MSEARALTTLIGNGVATVVVARWTGDLDTARMQRQLNKETVVDAEEPEAVLDQVEQHMAVSTAPRREEVEQHMPVSVAAR
jgi:aerobic C4-dicarboxylate transport protein